MKSFEDLPDEWIDGQQNGVLKKMKKTRNRLSKEGKKKGERLRFPERT